MSTTTDGHEPRKHPLILVIGATGTGKSNLAIAIAKHLARELPSVDQNAPLPLAAEIINADAMQMYAGLPIITNKLSIEEQEHIPHHLLGGIPLDEDPWSIKRFIAEADRLIAEIRSRGRIPIVVGGTGYYVHGLLLMDSTLPLEPQLDDGENVAGESAHISSDPEGTTKTERAREMAHILNATTPEIYARLKEVDPDMAAMWHPNDRRKLQRSLEIWYKTGRKASSVYAEQEQNRKDVQGPSGTAGGMDGGPSIRLRYNPLIFWLDADNAVLKERLNSRVETMVKAGLFDEARGMHDFDIAMQAKGIPINKTRGIWASIGYKEVEPWLEHAQRPGVDVLDKESTKLKTACIEAVKAGTRQYAKRQNRYIRIRFASALTDARISHQLFLLDCSNLPQWKAEVEDPARTLVDGFLKGRDLPAPSTLSSLADTTFSSMKMNGSNTGRQPRWCETCNKTMITESEWQAHLKSRSHKKVLEGIKKRATLRELSTSAAIEDVP